MRFYGVSANKSTTIEELKENIRETIGEKLNLPKGDAYIC